MSCYVQISIVLHAREIIGQNVLNYLNFVGVKILFDFAECPIVVQLMRLSDRINNTHNQPIVSFIKTMQCNHTFAGLVCSIEHPYGCNCFGVGSASTNNESTIVNIDSFNSKNVLKLIRQL